MSLDSSRLWDLSHQVSAFLAPLSGGSRPAKSFPIKIHGHPPYTNQTYIQSTALYLQSVSVSHVNYNSLCYCYALAGQIIRIQGTDS